MADNFGDEIWGKFVTDFAEVFHKTWRDEPACNFITDGHDSVEIRGINQIDVKLLSGWCAHHKLFFTIQTGDYILIKLLQTNPLSADNINKTAYSLEGCTLLLAKLKDSYPRDWRALEQILTPFLNEEEFKCKADTSQNIMKFDHDICIDMRNGCINGTVVDEWFLKAGQNMRISAHPTHIRFTIRQCETRHKTQRPSGKFHPFACNTQTQSRGHKYQESRDEDDE
jgi:hypothetical protein